MTEFEAEPAPSNPAQQLLETSPLGADTSTLAHLWDQDRIALIYAIRDLYFQDLSNIALLQTPKGIMAHYSFGLGPDKRSFGEFLGLLPNRFDSNAIGMAFMQDVPGLGLEKDEFLTWVQYIFGGYHKIDTPNKKRDVFVPILDVSSEDHVNRTFKIGIEFDSKASAQGTFTLKIQSVGLTSSVTETVHVQQKHASETGPRQLSLPVFYQLQAYKSQLRPDAIKYTARITGFGKPILLNPLNENDKTWYSEVETDEALVRPMPFPLIHQDSTHTETITKDTGFKGKASLVVSESTTLGLDYAVSALQSVKITFQLAGEKRPFWQHLENDTGVFRMCENPQMSK